MKTFIEIIKAAKVYSDQLPLQDAFREGARYAVTGKYYKHSELFESTNSEKIELTGDETTEIWKPAFEHEGILEVSSLGHVRNSKTGDILKEHLFGNYVQVRFMENGERKAINIHRLVALTFVPNPKNFPIVNHKDENKLNNRADNLEWCTYSYNISYNASAKKAALIKCTPVAVVDSSGKMVGAFVSLKEAANFLNASVGNIGGAKDNETRTVKGYSIKTLAKMIPLEIKTKATEYAHGNKELLEAYLTGWSVGVGYDYTTGTVKEKPLIDEDSPFSFAKLWNLYDKKVGPKEKLRKMWEKIPMKDKEKIFEYIPQYIMSQPDKKYRKNLQTFLNQRGWEDELIFKQDYEQQRAINLTAKAARILGSDYQG